MPNLACIAEDQWVWDDPAKEIQVLQNERVIVRKVDKLLYQDLAELTEILRYRVSTKNPNDGNRYYSVEDPMVAGKVIPGRWRQVSLKFEEGVHNPQQALTHAAGKITQVLAYGWVKSADSLPTPFLLSDDKALLSPFAHDTTSEKNAYVWEYRCIDPAYAQTLRDTISLIDGVIDAKVVQVPQGTMEGCCSIQVVTETRTWAGTLDQTWQKTDQYYSFAAHKVIESFSHIPLDQLATYRTTLETPTSGYKVSSLTDTTEEPGFGRLEQTQEKLFVGDVTAVNGTLQEEQYLSLLVDGIIRTTMWLNVPDADLDTAMATVAVAPAGYTVLKVANNYNGTGSFTLTRVMIGVDDDPSAMQMAIQWPSFMDEHRTYFYFGMDKTAAEAQYITLQTECDDGFKVDSVEIREWKFDTFVLVQTVSKLNTVFTENEQHRDYTKVFGLVEFARTILLNVAKASIDTQKAAILADTDIIVLSIDDNDAGQGAANIVYTWRSKPAAARSMGAVRSERLSQFHVSMEDRQWIDVNITDINSLKTAVAAAMAATDPYTVAAGEEVYEALGEDLGDKTARITQRVTLDDVTDPADYNEQISLNPHGLQAATMQYDIREYPTVHYTNVDTIFGLLQTFLGSPMKGRIQVNLNPVRLNGTFSMRALKEETPTWANSTPTYVKTLVSNEELVGETKTELATGVPVAEAAAIVDAATADADHNLDEVFFQERDFGEAHITKRQTKKYETQILVTDVENTGTQRAQKTYTWPLVLSANLSTIWTTALTYGVAGDWILHYREVRVLGNGMYSVTSYLVECTETELANYTASYTGDSQTDVLRMQDSAAIPDAAEVAAGVIERIEGSLNIYNKYDYVKTTSTAIRQDTGWVDYTDLDGTSHTREIIHGDADDITSVKADLAATTRNYLRVTPDEFELYHIVATREPGGVDRSTYWGTQSGYKTYTLREIERRNDPDDENGYKWRLITVTKREYIGGTLGGGPALQGAQYNITDPTLPIAESDSVLPHVLGRRGGDTIYQSIRITRTYSATWSESSTDEYSA